jgi:hypothetical protein
VSECRLCTHMCACLHSRSLAVRRALTNTLDVGDDGRQHDGCATPEGATRHSGGAPQGRRRYSAEGAGCCQSGSYGQPARPCSAVVRTLWAAATEDRRHDGEGDARTGGAIWRERQTMTLCSVLWRHSVAARAPACWSTAWWDLVAVACMASCRTTRGGAVTPTWRLAFGAKSSKGNNFDDCCPWSA